MSDGALVRVDQACAAVPIKGLTVEQAAVVQLLLGSRKKITEEEEKKMEFAKIEAQEKGAADDVSGMFIANSQAQLIKSGGGKHEFTYHSFGMTNTVVLKSELNKGMVRPAECVRFKVSEPISKSTQTYVLGPKGFEPSSQLQKDRINFILTPIEEFRRIEKKKVKSGTEGTSFLFATLSVLVSGPTIPFSSSDLSLGFARPVLSYPTKSREKSDFDIGDLFKSTDAFLNSLRKKRERKDYSSEYSVNDLLSLPFPELLKLCSLNPVPEISATSEHILSSIPSDPVDRMLQELRKLILEPSDYDVKEGDYKCCHTFPKMFAQKGFEANTALGTIVIPLGNMMGTSRTDEISYEQHQVTLESLFPNLKNWPVCELETSIHAKGKKAEKVRCFFKFSDKYPTSFNSSHFSDDSNEITPSNYRITGWFMLLPQIKFCDAKLSENQVWTDIIDYTTPIIMRWGKYRITTEELNTFHLRGGTGLSAHISDAAQNKLKPVIEGKRLKLSNRIEDVTNPDWSLLYSSAEECVEMCQNPLSVKRIQGGIDYILMDGSNSNPLCINIYILLSVTQTPKLNPGQSCVFELLRCLLYIPFLPCGSGFKLYEFMRSLLSNIYFRERDFGKKCVFYTDVAAIIAVFLHIVYHSTDCSIYCPLDIDVTSLGRDNLVSFVGDLCTKAYPWMKNCEFVNREDFIKSCFPLVNQALATLCHMNSIETVEQEEVCKTLREYLNEITLEKIETEIASFRQNIVEYQQRINALKVHLRLADFKGSHEDLVEIVMRKRLTSYTFESLEKGEMIPAAPDSDEEGEDI